MVGFATLNPSSFRPQLLTILGQPIPSKGLHGLRRTPSAPLPSVPLTGAGSQASLLLVSRGLESIRHSSNERSTYLCVVRNARSSLRPMRRSLPRCKSFKTIQTYPALCPLHLSGMRLHFKPWNGCLEVGLKSSANRPARGCASVTTHITCQPLSPS